MYLKKMIDLMSPPKNVDSYSIEKNIRLVEKHYNIKFPNDLVQFLTTYGEGQINKFISIYSVTNDSGYYEMIEWECQNYREFREMFPEKYKHNVFPEKDGLFPMGRTDGGCLIWWQTAFDPEYWTVVVYNENSWDYEIYNMQVCEFLYKYFTKQINCRGFSESLREYGKPRFVASEFDFKKYCD